MKLYTCKLHVAGDIRSVTIKGERNPVSYPEILVLRAIHGDDAVRDIEPCKDQRPGRSEAGEPGYLAARYGHGLVQQMFPGVRPQMPFDAEQDPHYIGEAPAKRRGRPPKNDKPPVDPGDGTDGDNPLE